MANFPVTVVIACFHCKHTIRRAIESVAKQTIKPIEVILVDDASEDGTGHVLIEIAQQYPGWIHLVLLKENIGAAGARNVGWEHATQPYIAFLDADDTWHPKKIEIQYAYMCEHPEVVLCGHAHKQSDRMGEISDWRLGDWHIIPINKKQLLLSNRFVTPSVMLRRDIRQRFVTGRRHMEDHMLWLEIVCEGGVVTKLSAELAAIYKNAFGEGGLSAQLWLMEKGDLANYYALYKKKSINLAQWLIYSCYSLVKYIRRLMITWINFRR